MRCFSPWSLRATSAPTFVNALQTGRWRIKIISKDVSPELHIKHANVQEWLHGHVIMQIRAVAILKFLINSCLNLFCKSNRKSGHVPGV